MGLRAKPPIAEHIKLDRFVSGGQAIGTLESGQKAFIWGGLPGELIEFHATKKKRNYLEGVATNIIEPSSERIQPHDSCYLSTSPWQVLNYDYELEQKTELVREAFRQEKIDITIATIATDDVKYLYRNKMEYSLWWDSKTEQISLAFHERGSHRKIPISSSSIEHPEVLAEAKKVIGQLNNRHEQARKYQSLVVRCNQAGQVSSALFENGRPHPKMTALTDELLGRRFTYSPNGFFQINLPVYELALREIAKHITTNKVVDMYAGVGTIGLTVAGDKQLTLVETNKDAFAELAKNCHLGAEAVLSASEDALEYITADATIIVDPPRAGLDKRVVERLLKTTPPTIIYLSCNPTTQARDIKPLLEKYQAALAKPYNFFPCTPHIENLVVLKRK
ncbi:MAG: RsmD family RNA methyltransferase [Candidatus Nomurabacteria bacterium]|jgi:23S rRNA (uracil1939-C5)-methyltransferase|nr:RsmD family RNA methyltransferase [Candidatus Nomurabacteria bacterium]